MIQLLTHDSKTAQASFPEPGTAVVGIHRCCCCRLVVGHCCTDGSVMGGCAVQSADYYVRWCVEIYHYGCCHIYGWETDFAFLADFHVAT